MKMTKPPINLQDLRRRIYRKAKLDKSHRFWGLFVHITKLETLEETYRTAKRPPPDTTHNPSDEAHWVSRVRENLMHGCVSSEGWHVQQEINLPGQESGAP